MSNKGHEDLQSKYETLALLHQNQTDAIRGLLKQLDQISAIVGWSGPKGLDPCDYSGLIKLIKERASHAVIQLRDGN